MLKYIECLIKINVYLVERQTERVNGFYWIFRENVFANILSVAVVFHLRFEKTRSDSSISNFNFTDLDFSLVIVFGLYFISSWRRVPALDMSLMI